MIRDFTFTHNGSGIQFVAKAIRRDKGQLRADVSIRHGKLELDRDEFRFSDRTKRNALANSAYKALKATDRDLDGAEVKLQMLLRQFNDKVEAEWQESLAVEEVPGLAEPVSPPWVIRDYAQEGAGTLLVGPPGAGKSITGLLMAQSVQFALPLIFPISKNAPPRRVLCINLERSKESLQNRLGMVNRVLGLNPTETMPQINARGRRWTDVQEAVRRHMETEQPEFVVLDSLSRMGMGSMSDDDVANQMMDEMNALGVCWVALGHTPRPQPGPSGKRASEHVFGSQMLTAAADFEIILKTKEFSDRTMVGLKVIKANDARKAPLTAWDYHFGADGLENVSLVTGVLAPDAFEED